MTRFLLYCSIPIFGWLSCTACADEPPQQIAGRDLAGWVADLDSENRTERVRAAKTLGAFETAAGPALTAALASDDPAIRYIVAVQLGRIGGESLAESATRLQTLRDDEQHPAVQLAAAFALCRAGQIEHNLDLLAQRLKFPERGMACSAAELLGMLGKAAAPAIPALEQALAANRPGGDGDYHIGGAAQNALRQIRSDDKSTHRE